MSAKTEETQTGVVVKGMRDVMSLPGSRSLKAESLSPTVNHLGNKPPTSPQLPKGTSDVVYSESHMSRPIHNL
jgi:hypothetical protein